MDRSHRSVWVLVTLFAALLTLVLASGTAVALPSSVNAPRVTFTRDTLEDKANGFTSADSSIAHFFDSDGEDLSVADTNASIGPGLRVRGDDPSRLIIRFDVPVSRLSLVFGNDDPCCSQEGDVAILQAFRRGTVVGSDSVVMNRNDAPDQTITVSAPVFRRAEFFFARGETPIDLLEAVDNIRMRPVCTIKGTRGQDRLSGDTRPNSICGFRGNDRITARGKNDFAHGGGGSDRVKGGPGNDTLVGGSGDDYLNAADGLEGNDTVFGGGGYDTCVIDQNDAVLGCEEIVVRAT